MPHTLLSTLAFKHKIRTLVSTIILVSVPDPHVTPARKRVWVSNVGILGCAESACLENGHDGHYCVVYTAFHS